MGSAITESVLGKLPSGLAELWRANGVAVYDAPGALFTGNPHFDINQVARCATAPMMPASYGDKA